jgi:hypothetical protein
MLRGVRDPAHAFVAAAALGDPGAAGDRDVVMGALTKRGGMLLDVLLASESVA